MLSLLKVAKFAKRYASALNIVRALAALSFVYLTVDTLTKPRSRKNRKPEAVFANDC